MNPMMTMMYRSVFTMSVAAMVVTSLPLKAKDMSTAPDVPIRMTVTATVDNGKRMPEMKPEMKRPSPFFPQPFGLYAARRQMV